MTIENQLSILIGLAIAALISFIGKSVVDSIAKLKNFYKKGEYSWAIDMTIEAACLLAEKMFKSGEGKKKLEFVLNYVKTEALRMGVDIDMVEVTNKINKFVDEVINAVKTDE